MVVELLSIVVGLVVGLGKLALGTIIDIHTYVGLVAGAAIGLTALKRFVSKAATAVQAEAKKVGV